TPVLVSRGGTNLLDRGVRGSANLELSRPHPNANQSSPRFDRYGDLLPSRALLRLGTTQRRHTRGGVGLAFMPDGSAAVTAQQDGLVRFFGTDNGRQLRAIDLIGSTPSRDRSLKSFALSPEGTHMAGAGFAFDPARRLVIQSLWIWSLTDDRL